MSDFTGTATGKRMENIVQAWDTGIYWAGTGNGWWKGNFSNKKCVHCALFISVFCFTQSLHTGTFPKKVLVQYPSGDRVNLWATGDLQPSQLPLSRTNLFKLLKCLWLWEAPGCGTYLSYWAWLQHGKTTSFYHLCPLFWFLPFLCFKRERHWSWAQDPTCCQHPAPALPTSTQWTHKRGSLEFINLYLTHLRHNHQLFIKKNTEVIESNHSSFNTQGMESVPETLSRSSAKQFVLPSYVPFWCLAIFKYKKKIAEMPPFSPAGTLTLSEEKAKCLLLVWT